MDPKPEPAQPAAQTQVPAAGGPPPSPLGGINFFVLIAGMFAFMYFFTIRPQKKQEKERRALLDALQKNDRVLTIGGMYGTVAAVNDDEVTLKVDEGKDVRVRVSRGAIQSVLKDADGKP